MRMGNGRGAYRTSVGKPEGRNDLEDLGINGRIIRSAMGKQGLH